MRLAALAAPIVQAFAPLGWSFRIFWHVFPVGLGFTATSTGALATLGYGSIQLGFGGIGAALWSAPALVLVHAFFVATLCALAVDWFGGNQRVRDLSVILWEGLRATPLLAAPALAIVWLVVAQPETAAAVHDWLLGPPRPQFPEQVYWMDRNLEFKIWPPVWFIYTLLALPAHAAVRLSPQRSKHRPAGVIARLIAMTPWLVLFQVLGTPAQICRGPCWFLFDGGIMLGLFLGLQLFVGALSCAALSAIFRLGAPTPPPSSPAPPAPTEPATPA